MGRVAAAFAECVLELHEHDHNADIAYLEHNDAIRIGSVRVGLLVNVAIQYASEMFVYFFIVLYLWPTNLR
jgi:hypothetical protein